MILIIWILAIGFAIYMLQRNVSRTEEQHQRSKERFERLLEQLRNKKSDAENKNDTP